MAEYPLEKVRNIGIMAHIDAGKTTVTERILYLTHKIYRMGETHDGNTQMDWMDQERERGITITSASTTAYWRDHKLNIIDTPGHVDFTVEVERSLRVLDGAITVLDAHAGVQPQTENVWNQADHYQIPRIIFANKMDLYGASFQLVVDSVSNQLQVKGIPVQIPIGEGASFRGIVDLIHLKAYQFIPGYDEEVEEIKIPDEMIPDVLIWRQKLLDNVCEFSDDVLEKYLNDEPISSDDLKKCIRIGTLQNKIYPILFGSGLTYRGVNFLLDAINDYLPSPLDKKNITCIDSSHRSIDVIPSNQEDLKALAFKVINDKYFGKLTYLRIYSGEIHEGDVVYNSSNGKDEKIQRLFLMHANSREEIKSAGAGDIIAAAPLKVTTTGNTLCSKDHICLLESISVPNPVIDLSIEASTKADYDKMIAALLKIEDEDPTFKVHTNFDTGETVISGMGELHLDVIVTRLKREFGVSCRVGKPQVSYRESIQKKASCEGKFEREINHVMLYSDVQLLFEPNRGKGNQFINQIENGKLVDEYLDAIQAEVDVSFQNGFVPGFPLIDVKATLCDGRAGDHSSIFAFRSASSLAFMDAKEKCDPVLMEPIMRAMIEVPGDYMGSVVGDLLSKRGVIISQDMVRNYSSIIADVPLSEMFHYITNLRSRSQGRGNFTMQFQEYREVPKKLELKIRQ